MPLLNFPWPFRDNADATLSRGFRNGQPVPAESLRKLVGRANTIGIQRQKILFQKSIRYTEAYNGVAAADTWRGQFHTSPNVDKVRMVAVLAPMYDPSGSGPDSRFRWTTTIVGGAATDQEYIYHAAPEKLSATVVLDDMSVVDQTWDLDPDTKYRAQMNQEDIIRVLSVTIYEIPKKTADPTDVNIIDPRPYYETGPIYDAAAAEYQSLITKSWKRQGTHHAAFCVDSTAGQTVTSSTWTNLIDGTTAAIGAATKGFQTWPLYHGALDGYDSGASTETVPITLYCWMKTDDAAKQAELRFVDATGVIATLTSTSTAGEWKTTDVDWTVATGDSTEKIDVQFRNADGTGTTTVMAAGCYEFEA